MNRCGVKSTINYISASYINAAFEHINDILNHMEMKFGKTIDEIYNLKDSERDRVFAFVEDMIDMYPEGQDDRNVEVVEISKYSFSGYVLLCGIIADIKVCSPDVVERSIRALNKVRYESECEIIMELEDLIYILDALEDIIVVINE